MARTRRSSSWWKGGVVTGHVLLAKRYDHDRLWTYYVRTEGPDPDCWEIRMADSRRLLGQYVEFRHVRATGGARRAHARSAQVIGESFTAQNVARAVREVVVGTPPRPLPSDIRRLWILGDSGEALGDISRRLPQEVDCRRVKMSVTSPADVVRALYETAQSVELNPEQDVIVLARGGGCDVILLEDARVARALGAASRRAATVLAVGHARDALGIGAVLLPELICTTPTDVAWLITNARSRAGAASGVEVLSAPAPTSVAAAPLPITTAEHWPPARPAGEHEPWWLWPRRYDLAVAGVLICLSAGAFAFTLTRRFQDDRIATPSAIEPTPHAASAAARRDASAASVDIPRKRSSKRRGGTARARRESVLSAPTPAAQEGIEEKAQRRDSRSVFPAPPPSYEPVASPLLRGR